MGEYANPTGYVDTQTGQHFRDLTTNIANIVSKASTDYIAKMKADAKEIEDARKKDIEDKNKIDQTKEDFNNNVGNVNKENLPVNFRPSFDPILNEVSILEGLKIKGTATNDDRDKLLKAKATPTKVSTMFGQVSAFGESFLKAYSLPTGSEGSLSLFTPEDIKVPLAILTKQQKGLKTSVPITYNEDLRDYETSIEVVDINGKSYPLTGQKLNDRSTDGGDLHYSIPVLFKTNDAYKVAKKDFWEAFTTEGGKKNYTGSLKKDFIKQDFTGKAPNGMNFSKGEAYIDIPGDKTNGEITQTTRKFYNIYDIDKLANDAWVEDQKVSFAEAVAQSPMSPKIAWFETLLPKLNQLNNSKDVSEEDKKTISALIKEFGGKSFEDERKEVKNPTEEQIKAAQNAYIFLAKQDLKDQYQYRPVLNEDGTEKTQTLNTSSTSNKNKGGGDDNIVYANTQEIIDTEIQGLLDGGTDATTSMYLNINGITNKYIVERVKDEPGKPGFRIFENATTTASKPMYLKDLKWAAKYAVKSQTKADAVSQALYEQNK